MHMISIFGGRRTFDVRLYSLDYVDRIARAVERFGGYPGMLSDTLLLPWVRLPVRMRGCGFCSLEMLAYTAYSACFETSFVEQARATRCWAPLRRRDTSQCCGRFSGRWRLMPPPPSSMRCIPGRPYSRHRLSSSGGLGTGFKIRR